ncbi:MAG: biopolymer transporter ExbD [Pirellulaceae bacterium]
MRWPSPFRDRRKSVELQLTPMIDCVFLLMIYFIWSASFAVAEKMLPSELTAASKSASGNANVPPPPAADFDDIVVRIEWTPAGPAWKVNDVPSASLAELRATLATIADIKRDAPIILDADPDVPLGDVIDVFDLSRVVGFAKVQFAASVGE